MVLNIFCTALYLFKNMVYSSCKYLQFKFQLKFCMLRIKLCNFVTTNTLEENRSKQT